MSTRTEDEDNPAAPIVVTTVVGTRGYRAPEVYKKTLSLSVDVYALGVVGIDFASLGVLL